MLYCTLFKKYHLYIFAFAIFICNSVCLYAYTKYPLNVFYEGKKVRSVNKLYMKEGRGYIPVNDVAKIYNMTVNWRRVSKEVTLNIHGSSILLKLNSNKVVINGVPRQMNNETKKIYGKVCVPLALLLTQSFAEAARCKTAWNNKTKTLEADKKVNVQPPHFYTEQDKTRVVIEYDHYVAARDSVKKNRVTLTFDHGISGSDEKFPVKDNVIKEIRMKQYRKKVVADIMLAGSAGVPLVTYRRDPHRVIVEVKREGKVFVSDKKKYAGPKRIIVIDPGHGGKDPGAIGRNGTKEKDINLKMALKLAKLLKREGNFKVVLTRADDTFVPLLERTDVANNNKADLFISIHCNSSLKRSSEGFEIYFLSGEASDKAAQATANLENSALQLEENSRVKKKKVEKLLWSIARNLFHRESADVCSYVLHQIKKRVNIKKRFAKQAKFYVLMNAKMPSVLIETGFLSNKKEEARLKSRRFQSKMVDAYYAGIVDYFSKK